MTMLRPWSGSMFARRGRIAIKVKVDGKWVIRATPYRVGQEAKAAEMLAVMAAKIQGLPPPGSPPPPHRSLAKPRSRAAKVAAKRKAGGCEACGWVPPGGVPVTVIAAHHIVHRTNGGEDTPENLLALCPNCHALAHAYAKRPGAKTRDGLLAMLRPD